MMNRLMTGGETRPILAYRFDVFEVRTREGILLRSGRQMRIQELPFRMLLVLIEHAGSTVSAEVLRSRVWSGKAFSEFDSGLRVAAAKLRTALGDSATKPKFIKTVSGQGYQFIAEVLPVEAVADSAISAHAAEDPSPIRSSRLALLIAGGLLALGLAGILLLGARLYARYQNRPLAGTNDKVALGRFVNSTTNHDFDHTLFYALRMKLEESPYLSLVPESRYRSFVKPAASASLQDELRACRSADAQILLKGRIDPAGPQSYRVSLMGWKCNDGRLLTGQQFAADSVASVLPVLDAATIQMRRRLGESDSSLQRFNVPLVRATTRSLAALKAFTEGEEKRLSGRESESTADYKSAIDLDPEFTLAFARLGTVYLNIEEFSLSRFYYRKAFDLRNRLTEHERLTITAGYYSGSTGEIQRAIEAYQELHSLYPRDYRPPNNLAYEYSLLGQPEKAVPLAREAIQLDPQSGMPYATLADAFFKSGDYSSTKALCDDPVREKSDVAAFHQVCLKLAWVQNDLNGVRRQMQWARGNSAENYFLEIAAWSAMSRGQVREAVSLFSQARDSALRNDLIESAALIIVDEAQFEADLGLSSEAHKAAMDALKLSPDSPSVQASAALTLARLGDVAVARTEAQKAALQAPLDTLLNSSVLASVGAAIYLQQHNAEAAIQSLEEARPIDFNALSVLAPAYYRGLAYMQSDKPREAAREFQRVLDHRAMVPSSPYLTLSELEFGLALSLAGDRANASRWLNQAASDWKDADANFPPLQELRVDQRGLSMAFAHRSGDRSLRRKGGSANSTM